MDLWNECAPIFCLADMGGGAGEEGTEVGTPIITFLDYFFKDASNDH